jgi:hypothetical protein
LIYQFVTLCRGRTLYPQVMIPFQPGFARFDLHYRGEWLGIHNIAFTKILPVCSPALGFASHTNTVLLPKGVTNKTKSNEPRYPPLVEQALCPTPIDDTTTKQTTPPDSSINQLRASHTTLLVVLLSRVVSQSTGPYEEVLGKQPEPPKMPKAHNHNQIE